MRLGRSADGRELTYDTTLYEFRLGKEPAAYSHLRELDDHAHIRWLALEQRDWFRKIDPRDLERCNNRAMAKFGDLRYADMTPEERVRADAARDDSVLAGKIVDADPVLVQAVAAKLEEQGLLGAGLPLPANPLASSNLPKGMEALSQLERAQAGDRKMTAAEKRLMNKILKNDDKEKARREKAAAKAAKRGQAQDPPADGEGSGGSGRQGAAQGFQYTDSEGNPIAPEADAIRPDQEQEIAVSDEARALEEMRARNRALEAEVYTPDVPGAPGAKKRGFLRMNIVK